jgi:hypothetical protein
VARNRSTSALIEASLHRSRWSPWITAGWLALVFLIASVIVPVIVPVIAADDFSDVRARAHAVLSDPHYQRRVPDLPSEDGTGGPVWRRRPGDLAPGDDGRPVASLSGISRSVAVILDAVLATLAAAVVVWVAAAVWRRRKRGRMAAAAVSAAAGWPAEEARVERRSPRGGEAERLAGEGRWAEALHALLLQTIRGLAARSPVPLPSSSTSRELLALVPLSGAARQAFAGMVRAVERSLFGGAPVGPEDYRKNRDRFRTISGKTSEEAPEQ